MAVRIVTADERMAQDSAQGSFVILGPAGVGKTSLLKTLPPDLTVCFDLEAGLKAVRGWRGASIKIETYQEFRDLVLLMTGPDPAVAPNECFSANHYEHVRQFYAGSGIEEFLASRSIVFVDSITDLSRLLMTYAKQQPEAFSEKTGKPDVRGAYGLLGREMIQTLKRLQRAAGKVAIFVGVLEKVTDEFHTTTWQPQIEGSKIGRELPGIVDQVMTMQFFDRADDGSYSFSERGEHRRLVCRAGNPWGLPAKDRSGRLDPTEAPDLGAVFAKMNSAN